MPREKLSSIKEWLEASEGDEFPESMPKRPPNVYGQMVRSFSPKIHLVVVGSLSFMKFVKSSYTYVETMTQFRELSKEGVGVNYTSNPNLHYKSEWKGWVHFLTGN